MASSSITAATHISHGTAFCTLKRNPSSLSCPFSCLLPTCPKSKPSGTISASKQIGCPQTASEPEGFRVAGWFGGVTKRTQAPSLSLACFPLRSLSESAPQATHKASIQGSFSFCSNSHLGISCCLILYVGLILAMGKRCSLLRPPPSPSSRPLTHTPTFLIFALGSWQSQLATK